MIHKADKNPMSILTGIWKFIKGVKKTSRSSSENRQLPTDARISVFSKCTITSDCEISCDSSYGAHIFPNCRKKLGYLDTTLLNCSNNCISPLELDQSLNMRAYRMSVNVL